MVFNPAPPQPYPWYSIGVIVCGSAVYGGFVDKTAHSGSLEGIQFIPLLNEKMLAQSGGEIISSTERSKLRLRLAVLNGMGGGRC